MMLFGGIAQVGIIQKQKVIDQFNDNLKEKTLHDHVNFVESAKKRARIPFVLPLSKTLIDIIDEDPYSKSTFKQLQYIADSLNFILPPSLPNIVYTKKLIRHLFSIPLPSQTSDRLLIEKLDVLDQNSIKLNVSHFSQYNIGNVKYYLNNNELPESEVKRVKDLNNLKVELTNSITGQKWIIKPKD